MTRPLALYDREERLTAFVHEQARRGWHVEQRHAAAATMYGPLVWLPMWAHLLLLVATFGLWLFFWLAMAGPKSPRRWRQVRVDDAGTVRVTNVRRRHR